MDAEDAGHGANGRPISSTSSARWEEQDSGQDGGRVRPLSSASTTRALQLRRDLTPGKRSRGGGGGGGGGGGAGGGGGGSGPLEASPPRAKAQSNPRVTPRPRLNSSPLSTPRSRGSRRPRPPSRPQSGASSGLGDGGGMDSSRVDSSRVSTAGSNAPGATGAWRSPPGHAHAMVAPAPGSPRGSVASTAVSSPVRVGPPGDSHGQAHAHPAAKEEAFAEYRRTSGAELDRSFEQAKAKLRDVKRRAKDAAAEVNGAKKEIDVVVKRLSGLGALDGEGGEESSGGDGGGDGATSEELTAQLKSAKVSEDRCGSSTARSCANRTLMTIAAAQHAHGHAHALRSHANRTDACAIVQSRARVPHPLS